MEINASIIVEVVYADENKTELVACKIAAKSTFKEAIFSSGILSRFPEIDLDKQKIGVFGKLRELDEIAKQGERIEIYRPLLIDPKESRRLKVQKKPR